jgi:hypothetical protein
MEDRAMHQVAIKKDNADKIDASIRQRQFISIIQNQVLEMIANSGPILVPSNFVSEFWTPQFILAIADSLRRPRKRKSYDFVSKYLQAGWKQYGLNDMTASELALFLNKTLNLKFTPAAARKMAYRLNLFCKRDQGPRPKRQVASKL